jgi:hypothetical protein
VKKTTENLNPKQRAYSGERWLTVRGYGRIGEGGENTKKKEEITAPQK